MMIARNFIVPLYFQIGQPMSSMSLDGLCMSNFAFHECKKIQLLKHHTKFITPFTKIASVKFRDMSNISKMIFIWIGYFTRLEVRTTWAHNLLMLMKWKDSTQ